MPQYMQAARPCLASELLVRRNWGTIASLFSPKPVPAEVPAQEAPAAAAMVLRWRDHQLLTASSHSACFRCGAVRAARRRTHFMASACSGHVPSGGAPPLRTLLRAGVFDKALQQAHPEVAVLAASLGWCAVVPERGVFERPYDDQRDMAPDSGRP
jgi:hypothetical protein